MIHFAHHSTTFGTRKKLSSLIGAFLTTSPAMPPSVTISARFFIAMGVTEVNIWYSAGGNFQSRVAVTAAMLKLQGAEIPGEVRVPHVMRQVTAADCNPDRVNEVVSGTSLAPDSVLAEMFAG